MDIHSNAALLIIDMQKGSFTSKTPRYDTEGTVMRINKLAQIFRKRGLPVIFIQHDGTRENEFLPSSKAWELLDGLIKTSDDIYIDKYANDPFYKSNLGSMLKELDVEELYITGCATDFCVESTIQSALAKDYNTVVVADAHTTGNRPHMKADKVIEHYNWVWQNMIPTKGKVEVKELKELI
mgnify:CR=1 FL=1